MSIQSFLNLPGPVKAGIALLTGASLISVIFLLASGNKTMLVLLFVIFIVVGMLGGLYALILRLRKKKSSNKMDKMMQQHNAGSPSSLSGADSRVKLDDLRQKFSSGIQQYRKHGKDIYGLPWYVIVGEPGSGKSEAIRRSGIGFPPNLQDEQQGIGGTINMNWWFTNHGVILDTAGRLLFEEVAPGATNEWKEFLTLLKKSRPNCPINGLVLTIPTDSLIKNTSAEIEEKARKIAVQLDEIQRILDIRFPVFILVTKADLVSGFREFFKDVQDPELEHQIVGWSNPAPLDDAFNPQHVDEYLNGLVESIEKRRYSLLRDPDHSSVEQGERWLDQVDSIYNFPRALEQIFPRLRRFLELIFVAGEWAQKPLFLRGIYITSSLQEGAVLDEELASALDIGIDELPEEVSFVRKGALFLRDVYIEKIFKEKSLVTRASSANKVVRKRQFLVFSLGFVALILSLGLAWFSASTLKNSIGEQKDYWALAASDNLWNGDRWRLPIVDVSPVQQGFLSNEDKLIPYKGKEIKYIDFLSQLEKFSREEIHTPLIFKPVEWISSGLTSRETERQKALKVIYEVGVLKPLVSGTHEEFELPDASWTPQARDALTSLIRLERQIAESAQGINVTFDDSLDLVPSLMTYLTGEPGDPRLVDIANWLYVESPGSKSMWPPLWASSGKTLNTNRPIRAALSKFISYVNERSSSQQANLLTIEAMLTNMNEIEAAEAAFARAVASIDPLNANATIKPAADILRQQLVPAIEKFEAQKAEIIGKGVVSADEPFLLKTAYERELKSAQETIQTTISEIRKELPGFGQMTDASGGSLDEEFTLFNDINRQLTAAQSEINNIISSSLSADQVGKIDLFDRIFLALDNSNKPYLQSRIIRYKELVDAFDSGGIDSNPIGRLKDRVDAYDGILERMQSTRSDYTGPLQESVNPTSRKLLELFEISYFKSLATNYRNSLASVLDGIRFPLVLPVSSDSLTVEELATAARALDNVDRELKASYIERFANSDRRYFERILERIEPVAALGRSLSVVDGDSRSVTISLPGQETQNEVLQKMLGQGVHPHINYKWEEISLNNSTKVRTRRSSGETVGKVLLNEPGMSLQFFQLGQADSDPLNYTSSWAPLQWLFSSKFLPDAGNRQFYVLVQRPDGGTTYNMIVSLEFPEPLPSIDDWPKKEDLVQVN